MARWRTVCGFAAVVLLVAAPVLAEHQQAGGATQQEGGAGQSEPSGDDQAMMMCKEMVGRGMMGHRMGMSPMMGMHAAHMPMMYSMMHQMMGGQTDPASIGMTEAMGAGNMEAKTMGRMLQMRGEMLRAIGEIMSRHGKAMEEEK